MEREVELVDSDTGSPAAPVVPALVSVDLVGVGTRLPQSDSPSEFYRNLLSGRDLITESDYKWRPEDYPDLPGRFGKLTEGELDKFDSTFFQIHGRLASVMDPQMKKLLEVSWEAWMDSGLDYWALRDSQRIGVYCGSCGSEVQGAHLADYSKVTGYEALGTVSSMMANRLSYAFSFRGPSKQVDTACSSSAIALHDALADIAAGRTDYALVVGANAILYANMMQGFYKLGMLSPDGKCKAFDASGNGYARAEGIGAIVLQRSSLKTPPRWAAISPYATFLNAGTNNDGFTKEGITFPNTAQQLALEKQVCRGAGINPAHINYVEAHGTGTVAGDGQELAAINNWYGKAEGRTNPVMIGSVKSNMGHCEGNSVLASLTKLSLSIENGMLPGNLHYHRDTPNPSSVGLKEGTLKVVDENTPWKDGLFAVSSFGFGGSNVHLVLTGKGGERSKPYQGASSGETSDTSANDGVIPLAARSAEGLSKLAKIVTETQQAGTPLLAPLRRFANSAAADLRLCHRGTLSNGELRSGATKSAPPQVWFAFSGNGSQWSQMACSLLDGCPTFQASVAASAAIVKPLGVDLLAEFRREKGWQGASLGALGLLSIQIGLVDTLKQDYGVTPDGMLGHSAGEIACTYASGTCTREQAMMIAYHRGRMPADNGIKGGLMAATGLSAEEAQQRVQGTPVVMACDNSPSSTTVSGPAEAVRALISELEAENVFARELTTNGVAWHSSCLDPVLPELLAELRKVIPNPAKRPASWVSACFPPDTTDETALYSSAEYQVHSYRNSVLFTSAAAQIPDNAILVEIGPHSILRSPLRQCRSDLKYVGTMRKGACGLETLATAVGDMWRAGVPVHWKVDAVPRGGSGTEVPRVVRDALVSWERQEYPLPNIMSILSGGGGKLFERTFDLGGEHEYLCDHYVDGKVMLPMTSFMVSAWECLAKQHGANMWDFPVEFEEVLVLAPVRAERGDSVTLSVSIDKSHRFQVLHDDEIIMEGKIKPYNVENKDKEPQLLENRHRKPGPTEEMMGIDPKLVPEADRTNFYLGCNRQGIYYGPKFQPVEAYGADRTYAKLRWEGDWIAYLDGVFQVANRDSDHELHVAIGVRRLVILDTRKGQESGIIERLEVDKLWNICKSPSLLLEAFDHEIAPRKAPAARLAVGSMQWVPYGDHTVNSPARVSYFRQLNSLAKTLASNTTSQLAKDLAGKLSGNLLSSEEQEQLVSADSNSLAQLLVALMEGQEESQVEAGIQAALGKDPFLSGFGRATLQLQLQLLTANQSASGFTMCEVGAGNGGHTKEALTSVIELPHSPLIKYTATDTTDNSAAFKEAVAYKKLNYKVWDINSSTAEAPGQYNAITATHLSRTAHHLPTALAALHAALAEGGFLLLHEATCALGGLLWGLESGGQTFADERDFGACTSVRHWKQLLAQAGFVEVSTARCPADSSASFLVRKMPAAVGKAICVQAPTLGADSRAMDTWIHNFVDLLEAAAPTEEKKEDAVWVHGDLQTSPGVQGFVNSARKEPKGDRVYGILSWETDALPEELVEQCSRLQLANNCFKDGRHGAYISVDTEYKVNKPEAEAEYGCHLAFATLGNLKSSVWRENSFHHPDLVQCSVAFGALNFRDVMLASGKLSKQQMTHKNGGAFIGIEFSGLVEASGKRVMGLAKNAIATKVAVPPHLIFQVPQQWSLAEAASVPIAYLTSYYALIMRGQVRRGMRVLVHSGTGAVGLAAIRICLSRGVEVFTTCGSEEKKSFLLETFPGLKASNIGDSRSTSFEGLVCNATFGQGVDLVLNSLSDDKLQASVRCLGKGGKLLEIGKHDILKGTPLSMKPLLQNVQFAGVDLDRVATSADTREMEELRMIFEAGIASGEVRPLPVTTFPRTNAAEAFRYMGRGVHIGKCMIDMTAQPQQQTLRNCMGPAVLSPPAASLAPQPALAVEPRFFCRPDRSYVITGGVGGFGMALADWLVGMGAKHLVLTSKRGVRTGSQALHLQDIMDKGGNFKVSKLDVADPEEAKQIIELAESMAPVGGIFHLAMTLTDKLLPNQTGDSWNACVVPKAVGAFNMDQVSRSLPHLEHFVTWSSIVSHSGNEGQCNYGFANACLDLLAEQRRAQGLPAFSIQFGVVDNVGVADKRMQELMAGGLLEATMPQPIDDCLSLLGRLLCGGEGYGAVMSSHWVPPDLLGSSDQVGGKGLLESVLGVLGLQAGSVSDTDTLPSLGMDSMQLVEVRGHLQRCLGRPVPLEEIGGLTIGKMKALEAELGPVAAPKPATPAKEKAAPATPKAKQPPAAAPAPPAPVTPTKKRTSEDSASSTGSPDTPPKGDVRPAAMDSSPTSSPTMSRPPSGELKQKAAQDKAASPEVADVIQDDRLWAAASTTGVLLMYLLLGFVPAFAFKAAVAVAASYGLVLAAVCIPLLWLAAGFALTLSTAIAGLLLGPQLQDGAAVRMWSLDFARWWLICRFSGVTNGLFLRHFRGTAVIPWFMRLMGAQVGEGVVIDSLDLMDLNFLEIGDGAVIGEHATVLAHTFKDGNIIFNKVCIPSGTNVYPAAVVTPATLPKVLATSTKLAHQAATAARGGKDGLQAALSNSIDGNQLSPAKTVALQGAAVTAMALITTLAAFVGCSVMAAIVNVLTPWCPDVDRPEFYAVAALVALTSSTLAGLLPTMLQAQTMALGLLAPMLPAAVVGFFAFPLAFAAYALALAGMSAAAKVLLVGKVLPGVHRSRTAYGVRFWAAQHIVECCNAQIGQLVVGTWLYSAFYRLFGAKSNKQSTILTGNPISVPDMLSLDSHVHIGDMAYVVTSMRLDAETVLAAPIHLHDQVLLGTGSVTMPGTTLGAAAALVPLSITQPGSTLAADFMCRGHPAVALMKSNARSAATDKQNQLSTSAQRKYQLLPLFLAVTQLQTAYLAILASAIGAQLVLLIPGVTGQLLSVLAAVAGTAVLPMLVCKLVLGYHPTIGCAGDSFERYSYSYFANLWRSISCLNLLSQPASLWAQTPQFTYTSAWVSGHRVGKRVYIDATRSGDPGLLNFADDTTVDRGALLLAHSGAYNTTGMHLTFDTLNLGAKSVIGPRSILMPGLAVAEKQSVPAGELIMRLSK